MEDFETRLVAPNKFERLIDLISDADTQATTVFEADDQMAMDYKIAVSLAKLTRARGILDSILSEIAIRCDVELEK